MIDETEWGPWVEHDGRGCPLPDGTLVMVFIADAEGLGEDEIVVFRIGEYWEGVIYHRGGPEDWVYRPTNAGNITRYRLRRPRLAAMDMLRDLVADPRGPVTAPAGPVRRPDEVPA